MGSTRKPPNAIVTVETYPDDPLYPRIRRATDRILRESREVAPVAVLVRMDLLREDRLEDWRRGRVPYLEKVIDSNLTRLSRLLHILRFHAHDLNLVPLVRTYRRKGKGQEQVLRFSKTRSPRLERAYSRHFYWPGKRPFHEYPQNQPREGEELA